MDGNNDRRIAAIAALAALVLFAGCGAGSGAPAVLPPAVFSQGESDASGTGRGAKGPSPSEEETVPFDGAACRAALEAVTRYELGSAGSSLKAVIAAAKLLEFTQTYDGGQKKELACAAADYLGGLDGGQRAAFAEHLPVIEETAREILNRSPGIGERLEEAGSPLPRGDYSGERFDGALAVIGAVLRAETAE